ncbi:MAG: hypothetical protein H0U40_09020 [Chloroflexia bacterium]|nr:hypothetical protein [Chloroflexia bacterium]
MPRRTLSLTPDQAGELTARRDRDPRPWVREQCAAMLKFAAGAAPAVARTGLLRPRDPDTVYGWLTRYERQGLAGILTAQHGGPRRRGP